jgi:shikimate kinase
MGDVSARRNVVLTGFMGTGKTTVGRLLAERLGYEFVDTDAVIEAEHGPIPGIFAASGEVRFRELEREVASDLAHRSSTVISTGGRMLLDVDNAAALSATGEIVCLTASVDTVLARVGGDRGAATRPMLAGSDARQRVTELMAERAAGYGRFRSVATDDLSPADVVDAILAALAPAVDG